MVDVISLELALRLLPNVLNLVLRERHQNHLTVRPVLGLREQVGGCELHRCLVVNHHQNLRRASGHINSHAH